MPPAGPPDDFDPLRHRREIEMMEQRFRERSQQAGDEGAPESAAPSTNESDERVSDEMRDFFCDSTQRLEMLVPQLQPGEDEKIETTGEILRSVESVFGSLAEEASAEAQAEPPPPPAPPFPPLENPAPPYQPIPEQGHGGDAVARDAADAADELPDFLKQDPFGANGPDAPPATADPFAAVRAVEPPLADGPPPAPPSPGGHAHARPPGGAYEQRGGHGAPGGGAAGGAGDPGDVPEEPRPPHAAPANPAAYHAPPPPRAPAPAPKKRRGKLDLKTALARLKSGKPMNAPKDQREDVERPSEAAFAPPAPDAPGQPAYQGGGLPQILSDQQPGGPPLPSQPQQVQRPRTPEEERARLEEIQRRMRVEGPGWQAPEQPGEDQSSLAPPGSQPPPEPPLGQEVYMPAPSQGGPLMAPPPPETNLADDMAAGFDQVFDELEDLVRGSLGEPAPATLDWLATSEIIDADEISAVVSGDAPAEGDWQPDAVGGDAGPDSQEAPAAAGAGTDEGLSQDAMLAELKRLRELKQSLVERGIVPPDELAAED